MVVVSLDAAALYRAAEGASWPFAKNQHDQARRENSETETDHVAN
jgi:hypothetical protein